MALAMTKCLCGSNCGHRRNAWQMQMVMNLVRYRHPPRLKLVHAHARTWVVAEEEVDRATWASPSMLTAGCTAH